MNPTDGIRTVRVCIMLTVGGLLLAAGCETSSGKGYDIGEGVSCEVPQRCDDYTAANAEDMHSTLLRLYDQIEMSSGPGNARRVTPILQQLEYMLNQCPRLVLPELMKQIQRPVHELQRANLALVLGWFPEGKSCTAPVLAEMLDDSIPLVRFSAASALVDLKDERGLPTLVDECLAHPNESVRRRALEVLSDFAGQPLSTRQEAESWYARR